MKNDKEQLYKIVKNLDGMSKVKAYDINQQIEVLLFYASDPISIKKLKKIIAADIDPDHEIDPFHFTILPNGNFCEFDGHNDWLHIYKENKKLLPDWSLFDTYYFKTKYAPLELIKLTKKNILEGIEGKPEEGEVRDFLKQNKITKKEGISDKLLILNL